MRMELGNWSGVCGGACNGGWKRWEGGWGSVVGRKPHHTTSPRSSLHQEIDLTACCKKRRKTEEIWRSESHNNSAQQMRNSWAPTNGLCHAATSSSTSPHLSLALHSTSSVFNQIATQHKHHTNMACVMQYRLVKLN